MQLAEQLCLKCSNSGCCTVDVGSFFLESTLLAPHTASFGCESLRHTTGCRNSRNSTHSTGLWLEWRLSCNELTTCNSSISLIYSELLLVAIALYPRPDFFPCMQEEGMRLLLVQVYQSSLHIAIRCVVKMNCETSDWIPFKVNFTFTCIAKVTVANYIISQIKPFGFLNCGLVIIVYNPYNTWHRLQSALQYTIQCGITNPCRTAGDTLQSGRLHQVDTHNSPPDTPHTASFWCETHSHMLHCRTTKTPNCSSHLHVCIL